MSGHEDLYKPGFGHHRHKEPVPEICPGDQAPRWANVLSNQMALLIKEIRDMKQSTTDVVNAVNALVANSAQVDAAIDALVAAKSDDDDAAVEAAVSQLQSLKSDQDKHLAGLVAAVPPVVAAPADPAASSVAAQIATPPAAK